MPHGIRKLKDLFHKKDVDDEEPVAQPSSAASPAGGPDTHTLAAFVLPNELIPTQDVAFTKRKSLENNGATSTKGHTTFGEHGRGTERAAPFEAQHERQPVVSDIEQDLQRLDLNTQDTTDSGRRAHIGSPPDGPIPMHPNAKHFAHDSGHRRQDSKDLPGTTDNLSEHHQAPSPDESPKQHETETAMQREIPVRAPGHRYSVSRKPVGDRDSEGSAHMPNTMHESSSSSASHRDYHDASEPPNLAGIVDLTNTVDSTVHESMAPAVTHEHKTQHVHHIREERIQRDVHTHDIYHRIQPIVDVQVLPARHFAPGPDGTLVEINADRIPGMRDEAHEKLMAETLTNARARAFDSAHHASTDPELGIVQTSHVEHTGQDGVFRQKTTYAHPPELEQITPPAGS